MADDLATMIRGAIDAHAAAQWEWVNGHRDRPDRVDEFIAAAIREWAMRPENVERVAREFVHLRGGHMIASDTYWAAEVADYREMVAKHPDYANGRSLITSAFTDARAAIGALLGEAS